MSSQAADRHVRLYHRLMRTAAWKDLDANAKAAYVELAARYRGNNNGLIPYSAREMGEALKVSRATARRTFASLVDHGFIVEMKKGAFTQKVRHSSEWRLTEHVCDVTKALPSKEYMHWIEKNTVSPETPNAPRHETERCAV